MWQSCGRWPRGRCKQKKKEEKKERLFVKLFGSYPLFVAVFWVLEKSCLGDDFLPTPDSLSPLITCMFAARYHLLVAVVGWMGLVVAVSLLYFLRFLDERRFLRGSSNARWWHLGPFVLMTCLLFWLGLASCMLSLIMLGKPLLSSRPQDSVLLAAPGLVLFCGNVLLLIHLGRKLAAAFAFRLRPKTSFFIERGVSLSPDTAAVPLASEGVELDSVVPYVSVEENMLY